MKLEAELVPKTQWNANLRKELPRDQWDSLRKECYRVANYTCEICGGIGPNHPVECHEIWHYDDQNHIQRLDGLIALCPSCHLVKHLGYANVSGKRDDAIDQLIKVNNITMLEALHYIEDVFNLWRERSKHQWELDLSWLDKRFK